MVNADKLELAISLVGVSVAKGQSVGKIPIEEVYHHDYVQSAIQDARSKGATVEQLREAIRRGLRGRPNPSLN